MSFSNFNGRYPSMALFGSGVDKGNLTPVMKDRTWLKQHHVDAVDQVAAPPVAPNAPV